MDPIELKERIIENASALFFRNGVKSMTMSDIANKLGISKRTLYEVFCDKEELLMECIDYYHAKADRKIEQLTRDSENVIDTLIRLYAQNLFQVMDVGKPLMNDLKKYYSHLFRKIEDKRKEDICVFIPLFEKGAEQGLIRQDVNFEILLWMLKVQLDAVLGDDEIPTGRYSVNQFLQTIIQNFIRGIATPLGNERIDRLMENNKEEYQIKI
ncbi:MAG: TetR/AcrR family transcriptional regulator [Dysgonamonadaceae bacterium]|jgi:AcrR family transcriptional regulator|nr:TetR/AcrR family transcriptional regulator [Dysgonamonadaceae bacterium]